VVGASFGSVHVGIVVTPWPMIDIVVVGMPVLVGLTASTVRSAPTVRCAWVDR
jgi:hypothetical protein